MFCPNCGKELPDIAKFCSGCGQPVIRPQEQPAPPPVITPPVQDIPATKPAPIYAPPVEDIPATEPAPIYAPPVQDIPATKPAPIYAPPVQQPVSPPIPPAASDASGEPAGGGKRRGRGLILLGIGAVVLALIVIAAVAAVSALGGGSGSQVYVYLTDDNELMFLKDLKEKTQAVEFSDEATTSSRVVFSKNGKYIYYIELEEDEYSGNLYRAEISKLGKNGEAPLKISNSVFSLTLLDNGDLIYRKDRSGQTQIFLYSGEESYKLISDVSWFGVDAGGTYGYYTEYDDNGSVTLSRIELKPDGEKETVIKRADNIFSSYFADVLLYGEKTGVDADYNTIYTLYSLVPGGEKERLAKDVSSVLGVTAESGKLSFYYTTCQEETFTLYDFVSDSMKNSDANSTLKEPEYPNYSDDYEPWYGIYTTDDGREYYESYSRIAYYLDYERYPNMDPVDMAYAMAQNLYDAAVEAYYADYEAWYEVNQRNYIREALSGEPYTITSYTLYRCVDGESTEIASRLTGAYPSASALDAGVCFYNKVPGVDSKLTDLADLEYYYDIYDLILDSFSVDYSRCYLNVSGNESEFKLEDDDLSMGSIYVISDKELVISVYEDGEQSLLSYSIGKDTLTYQDTIVEDYYSAYNTGDGKLYYYVDWNYNSSDGDLYCYGGGKSTRIASEIHTLYEVGSGAARYVLTDWEYNSRNDEYLAEFAMLDSDGKAVRISDEVRIGRIWFLDEQKVMYISDSDLYYWDGRENRRVASDVEYLWLSRPESYRSY